MSIKNHYRGFQGKNGTSSLQDGFRRSELELASQSIYADETEVLVPVFAPQRCRGLEADVWVNYHAKVAREYSLCN